MSGKRFTKNTEAVSVRLPKAIVDKLDAEVGRLDTSRTDVIRAALATYFRLENAVLVPITAEERNLIARIAKVKRSPAETVAADLLSKALDESQQPRTLMTLCLTVPLQRRESDRSWSRALQPIVTTTVERDHAKASA